MTRRLVPLTLCLLVAVLLFAEAGRNLFTPRDRALSWLQVLVSQQLADTFGREVQLGRIEIPANLAMGVVANRVAIAEKERLADGAIVRAERLELRYDLVRVLRGELAPAASVNLVRLSGAYAKLVRDEAGELNLSKILPEGPPAPPEERFRGKVEIADSEIYYEDRGLLSRDRRPLTLEFAGVEGEVDLMRRDWLEASLSGWERLGRFAFMTVSAELKQDSGFAWVDAELSGVDLPWWYDFFAASPELDLRRGTADLSGNILVVPRGEDQKALAALCDCKIRNGNARIKALNDAVVDFDGEATATLEGVEVRRLEARVGGTHLRAEGFVTDLRDR